MRSITIIIVWLAILNTLCSALWSLPSIGFGFRKSRTSTKKTLPTDKQLPETNNSHKWDPDKFEFHGWLGSGGFGKVREVVDRDNKKLYALKIVPFMGKTRQQTQENVKQLHEEIKIHKKMDNKFVIKLHDWFQDDKKFYLQMDIEKTGEFYNLMASLFYTGRRFSLDQTAFYAAEILLALEHIQGRKVVYRDLKPENILVTVKGHIKIIDFGVGKELEENDRTSTMCGSVEYMAPEIAKGPDYSGYKSDSWSLGVLIYVMLTGWNPFDPDNHKEDEDTSCKNILGQLFSSSEFNHLPLAAKDFVKHLLVINPDKRYSVKEAKDHHWFKEHIMWDEIEAQTNQGPFILEGDEYVFYENGSRKTFQMFKEDIDFSDK
ncbi:protein kinase domain-containing protein [Ditylenchus destructor]|uniref:Protein kinase domain-containing protein n=1 Tax=Ditylenchus destructor TaxID=166010 RepID=A0AAD4MTR4_9BILA|nr:protein kinase domain-containing protein [Ditylenchus destructor]